LTLFAGILKSSDGASSAPTKSILKTQTAITQPNVKGILKSDKSKVKPGTDLKKEIESFTRVDSLATGEGKQVAGTV